MAKLNNSDVAIRRFQIITGLIQYEGTVFWSRSQHYLVANAALLGFIATKLPTTDLDCITWANLYTVFIGSIGGLLLAIFWNRSLKSAEYYLTRWINIAKDIEPLAFDEGEVFRNAKSSASARKITNYTSLLFITMWSLVCVFLIICFIWKFNNWKIL
ncbi:MAG: hypothetical protein AABX63_00240 [Nanoarchaeota archaeon]